MPENIYSMSLSYQANHKSSPFVAPLSHFGRADLAIAGGKGANLGELAQAGFDVPPGFIITTAVYDLLLQTNGLQTQMSDVLASLNADDSASVADISQRIRDLLQHASIPRRIADEVIDAYRQLGESAVAVRSSATAEDLPDAAFAGQQETFLNVVGEQALLDAVRGCWESLWSERALLYRARQNVDQNTVKLAVVVQQMVPADVAGVMFTANPVSGERNELVIDASPGLGEAVVGGMVTPDHFVVDKSSKRVKEQRLGRREVIVRAKAGGGTEQISPTSEVTKSAALPSQTIRRLSELGILIERHFDSPQDIEWAWINDKTKTGKLFILQARPMTALPEPLKVNGLMRGILPMLVEMWPARPYPLDLTTFTGAVERAIGNFLVTMIGESAPDPGKMLLEEDGVVVRFEPPELHLSASILYRPWIAFWQARHYDPSHWEADPLLAEFIAKARELEKRDLQPLTWSQIIETLHESLALIPRAMVLRERYLPNAVLGLGGLWLLLKLARHSDRFGTLISGIKTKTTETNQALEDLAKQIRTDPVLQDLFAHHESRELKSALEASKEGKAFLEGVEAFLDQFGHRETALTISQPAWKDQPEIVLGILKTLAETEPHQSNSYEAWQRTRDELLAGSILGTRFLRNVFLRSLTNARALFQIREDTHFYATLLQPVIRRVCLELGERLVEVGGLSDVSDVFHLRLEELESLDEPWPPYDETLERIRALVKLRKAKRESLAKKPMVDPRLLAVTSQARAGEDVLLNGSSGSPGIASGPARIVHNVSEFGKLRAGDVLVAPATNPSWTPLFQRAVAVVVDTGGSASHAAIVAREYGVPAVMSTVTGTQELKDGQWIQVDGSRGLVLKAEETK